MSSVTTINPATGQPIETYKAQSKDEIELVVDAAAAAARSWGATPLERRLETLAALSVYLRGHAEEHAALATSEMGKPLAEARGELEKSAVTADYYVANADEILADTRVDIDSPVGIEAWSAHEPIGLVLAVMPWNFPIWQVMRFAVPAVAAGNGVLLKHSPNVTGSALALERAFREAGFPEHVLSVLVIDEPDVPATIDALISDPRIAAVTLTGSNRAGAAVGAAAGRESKRSVLELGGSDAFVVLADAEVETAAAAAVSARYTNSGQSCVCAKRFIVAAEIADEFIARFVAGAAALKLGDPSEPGTEIGPLARADLRAVLQRQVDASVRAGATVALGGHVVPGDGTYYAPTVLTGTGPGMPVFDEETFGPVAAIAVAKDDGEAAALADATEFGLGLSVWSGSVDRALAVAARVTTGAVFVNSIVASDPRVPFGGTKRSGYGRELAAAGILEFTNMRTYWVRSSA
jgi:acyl-CoA reductase-like NAD-dependent aldehyde dehydrogenase